MSVLLKNAEQARGWIESLPGVSRETLEQLECFSAMLIAENDQQNLVAASTLQEDALWTRHMADSAQLVPLAGEGSGRWIDLGSGPGLPGLVVAILAPQWHMTLAESRRLRCDFLRQCVEVLDLESRVTVFQGRVESLPAEPFDVISARAFAPLPRLIDTARHLARRETIWLLPKGKNAQTELSSLPATWQNSIELKPSLTDSDAGILVARGDFPKSRRAKSSGRA